jgi:hypothetical protein
LDRLPPQALWMWICLAVELVIVWRFFFALSVLKDVTDLVVEDQRSEPPPPKACGADLTKAF